jgi:hypothetical protein
MGVQVGNICFKNQQEADNYVYSQAVPHFTAQGVISPVYNKNAKSWIYQGETIHANLPECSQVENFIEGQLIGWIFVLLIVSAYKFKVILRMLS